MGTSPAKAEGLEIVRQILLVTVILSMIGVEAELFLLDHVKALLQLIPVFLLGLGLGSIVAYGFSPSGRSLRILRGTMALCIASGVLGVFVHLAFSASEATRKDKNLYGMRLFRAALTGVAPPFAPGAMIQIGLIGLAYTYTKQPKT
jgi:hypothetical protein